MNPQHLNYNQTNFIQEKQKWESAINNYTGPDPLDLWYNFICWYEQNSHLDHERLFETALGKCLSIYECQQQYNQDTRLVKLWMKYIGLKSNPLNLYQVLYQRGIGTQCAIFYVGWAHYYDAANAFKQAESVFNLGFQANAQPYNALEQAHKNFRFSLSQRMLYNDQQSKKRSASQLSDQRQQITTLNPASSTPNATNPPASNNFSPATSMNQQQHPYPPQQQQPQPQQQPPLQPPTQESQATNSYHDFDGSTEHQPPMKKFRNADVPSGYNQNYNNSIPNSNAQMEFNAKTIEYNNQYNSPKVNNDNLTNSNSSPAHAIACSLNSVYSGDEDQGSEDYGSYNYAQNTDETLNYNNETLTYSQTNQDYATTSTVETNDSLPSGCILPSNHVSYAKNHFEPWDGALFLDEPDANKICKYPRHLVYPGNGSEYSLEEIRARNYTKVIETIKEQNRQREIALNEQRHMKDMQQQQQMEHERQMRFHQQKMEEQKREREHQAEIERERMLEERERNRLAEIHRAKEQEEAHRLRMLEQQKMQQMQEQTAYMHQSQQQYQPVIPQNQHQPIVSQNQHQPIVPQNQHQPIVPQNQHQPIVPPNQHQPIVPQNQHQPIVPQNQHQPIVPQNQHQPIVPQSQHQPIVPQNQHQPIVPQNQHQSIIPQSQHQSLPPNHHQAVNSHSYYGQNPVYNNYSNYPAQNHQNHHYSSQQHQQQQQQQPPQPYYNQRPVQQQSQAPPMQYQSQVMDQNEMYKSRIPYSSQSVPSHNQMPVQHPHMNSNPPMQAQYQEQHYNYQPPLNPPQQQYNEYQSYQTPSQPTLPNNNHTITSKLNGNGSAADTGSMNNYVDDIEEQIEASTIVLKNGSSKPQKITIKYRKEKSGNDKQQAVPLMDPLADNEKTPKTRKSKKSKSKLKESLANGNELENSNFNNDLIDDQCNESMSNDSYSTPSTASRSSKTKKSKKAPKFEPAFLQNDESCSNSEFTTLYGKYSNEVADEKAPNGTRNVHFNFAGATSTPIRNNNNIYQSPCSSAKPTYKSNDSSSKSSTPRNTHKSLRRRTSNSLLNHTLNDNDDSMTSFSMVEPNSFFETENNDELRQQRLDNAMKTIDEYFKKEHIDPFNSELCKALLVKADFPSREQSEFHKLSNLLLSKLSNSKYLTIGDVRFNVEKEIGRGAYGSVYRGTNSNTGDVVALKFQKPPNTWELYICTEVSQRIKDQNLLLGYMDISLSIIAPNASIFVSEFSQFGSLLDINNRIRQSTTKVMHESLVMHFTSQILNIIHHLHSCQIIHGDIKPDNFLLMKIPNPNSDVPTLRLIDFGCAIDMKFFKPNTQFKKIIQTDGFTCPEMLEGRLWSYQTDIFCIAGTVHVMLFGEYMQMLKKFGQYEIKQKLPRYLKKHIWTEFFTTFLNIKDAHKLPNLLKMKEKIDDELLSMESELQSQIRTLSNILYKR